MERPKLFRFFKQGEDIFLEETERISIVCSLVLIIDVQMTITRNPGVSNSFNAFENVVHIL